MAQSVLHKADTRGKANHGWLNSHHTFSFANYYDRERMNFGVLRVLNDDIVAPAMGFGTHPHDNMEIISIPLSGDLVHKDSMGNEAVIRQNEVQIMSAGTGILHSEKNKNHDAEVRFLQIWVFPNERNVTPRYEQREFLAANRHNQFQTVVAPIGQTADSQAVGIHQDAWFSLGTLEKGFSGKYDIHQKGNGVYVFVIEGAVQINGQTLEKRDGLGIWDTDTIDIIASEKAELLLMDVPMNA